MTAGPSRLSLWAPVVACMALIFELSSMSSPPSPGAVNDKVLHFAAYGGLATLCLRATSGGRLAGLTLRAGLLAWGLATAYGATDGSTSPSCRIARRTSRTSRPTRPGPPQRWACSGVRYNRSFARRAAAALRA